MLKSSRLKILVIALSLIGMGPAFALDDSTTLMTQSSTMDQLTSQQSTSKVTTKFASDFSTFAGSQQNAEALITGLRNSTPINLTRTTTGTTTGTTPGTTTSTTTTITPPTKPMGFGNTFISLSLAQAQLAQNGITEPTPEQINAALTGGTLTTTSIAADGTVVTKTVTLDGILTQRADGLGWGQIAKANGFKLGQVISSVKSANKSYATDYAKPSKLTTDTEHKTKYSSVKSKTEVRHEGGKYNASAGRGITSGLGGGGVVYGKSHVKTNTALGGHSQQSAKAAAQSQRVSIVTATGSSAGHGNANKAQGHGKGPK